jgi:hypothetical protein
MGRDVYGRFHHGHFILVLAIAKERVVIYVLMSLVVGTLEKGHASCK